MAEEAEAKVSYVSHTTRADTHQTRSAHAPTSALQQQEPAVHSRNTHHQSKDPAAHQRYWAANRPGMMGLADTASEAEAQSTADYDTQARLEKHKMVVGSVLLGPVGAEVECMLAASA